MPAINESCIYRSMAGEPWEAVITGIGPPGFVSVSLTGPFLKEPFELRAVRWSDDPADSRSGARPRRATCDNPAEGLSPGLPGPNSHPRPPE
jgi:hypothetical protein